jgi:hypothetical protein
MWYNPSTWAPIDAIQGILDQGQGVQTNSGGAVTTGSTTQGQVLGGSYTNNTSGNTTDPNTSQTFVDAMQGYSGGSGGSSTAPSYSQQDMDYLNNQQSLYERLLQSLGTGLNSGITKLDQSKIDAENKAGLSNERAQRDFGIQREYNQRDKGSAIEGVNSNARNLSDSFRRILGMASGANSSAYKFAAPNAVARQASQGRNKVMDSFGRNELGLDKAVEDTNVDFQSLLGEIAKQRREKEEALRSGVATQEQGVQNSLAEIAAERARLQGGNALSAMRPYQDRFNSLQDTIDQLPSRFASNITPRELSVAQPKLSDYLVDRQAINASEASGQSQYSPYSAFLKSKDDEEQQLA